MKQLRDRGVNVEQLLSHDDARKLGQLSGSNYLQDLANKYTVHPGNPQAPSHLPLIIFSTPEIIIDSICCRNAIKRLAEEKLLSLVVIDEFDYVESCHEHFRRSYVNLVSSLKVTLCQDSSQIPFLFLSATGSSDLIFEQLETIVPEMTTQFVSEQFSLSTRTPPVLYQTSHVLPSNHIYRG
jgi:superfamily II DNA helicase RecQ